MIRPVREEPYGGFDGHFPLGVTFSVNSREAWDVLRGVHTLTLQEMEELAERNPRRLFSIVSTATVVEHETRHFHDFLLSPLGVEILSARLSGTTNAVQAMGHLLDEDIAFDTIPLPLSAWAEMSTSEQDAFIGSIQEFLQTSNTGTVHLTPPALLRNHPVWDAFKAAGRAMRVVDERVRETEDLGSGRSISLVQLAETSALMVQIQAIWTTFGEAALHTFMSTMLNETYGVYGDAIGLLQVMQVPANLIAKLTTWSFITSSREQLTATQRFIAGLADVGRSELAPETSFDELAHRWEAVSRLKPWQNILQDSVIHDGKLLALRTKMARTPGAPAIFAEAATYLQHYLEERERLIKEFVKDPDDYCSPASYISRARDRYPEPLVGLKLGGIDGTREDLERAGFIIVGTTMHNGREVPDLVVLPHLSLPPEKSKLIFEQSQSMILNFLVADALTTHGPAAREAGERIALQEVVGVNKRLLRLPI